MYVGFFHENRRCMNKIVYVEDEPEVGQQIAAYLGKHDMDVIVEPRGDRAEEVVVRENPDLVLLDIMLPGKDGMTLCRDLRARWEGPIVLLARLRLHLRQHASIEREAPAPSLTPHKAMRFGTLSIDPINRQVLLSGELIALSTADFDLLWELATHAGQIMDRDALLKNLRGVSYDGMDRSVDVAISRLRKKLQDNATEPYRIKTVRNKGYLFAPHAWET